MDKIFTPRIRQGLVLAAVALIVAYFVHPAALLTAPVIFGVLNQQQTSDRVRELAAWGILDPSGGGLRRVIAKTADYTIVDPFTAGGGDASGTIFTNRGAAGAVIWTLPAPVPRLAGCTYEFLGVAGQNQTIRTATVDTLIGKNDLTADSVAMSTAGELIGAHARAVCDGTSWVVYGDAVGHTFTLAT